MSDLTVIEQRTVTFYEDEIPAVLVEDAEEPAVFVPLRPICDFLGVAWPAQRLRVNRDPVLSEVAMSVIVTITDIPEGSRRPKSSKMLCIPLDFINGFLFGISASRVKDEVREQLIRYQRECYKVLSKAFQATSSDLTSLAQVRALGLAIAQLAEEQMEYEQRLTVTEGRVDKAATIVGDLTKRVKALETKTAPKSAVSDEQAAQLSQAVKAVAMALGEKSGRIEYGGVYGELYRRYMITSYKLLPLSKFDDAMSWLSEWLESLTGETPF